MFSSKEYSFSCAVTVHVKTFPIFNFRSQAHVPFSFSFYFWSPSILRGRVLRIPAHSKEEGTKEEANMPSSDTPSCSPIRSVMKALSPRRRRESSPAVGEPIVQDPQPTISCQAKQEEQHDTSVLPGDQSLDQGTASYDFEAAGAPPIPNGS